MSDEMAEGKGLSLQRRLLLLTLNLKPGDLRAALNAHPVRVSTLLSGAGRLSREEARRARRLFGSKAMELFQ